MKTPNFTDPQFVDALGSGGVNVAFTTAGGAITAVGTGTYSLAGLVKSEAMTVTFSGMTATITLPSPWALMTSGGTLVYAHGTQTNADTQTYSVNLTPLIPAVGVATAYISASVTQIQQNPIPIPGPPVGHPSYDPNFIPTVGYATNVSSVAVTGASGTAPNNTSSFELLRTTLVQGQVSVSTWSYVGQQHASLYKTFSPVVLASGGVLTLAQAQTVLSPGGPVQTQTLPHVDAAKGLSFEFLNTIFGNWTIAAQTGEGILGLSPVALSSFLIPNGGACSVWSNGSSWYMLDANPVMENSVSGALIISGPPVPSYGLTGVGFIGVFNNGAWEDFNIPGTYNWIAPINGNVRARTVGGGGGAGGVGGGGGGGYSQGVFTVVSGTTYVVTVGAGGASGASNANGGNGGTSSFSGSFGVIQATGGFGGVSSGATEGGGAGGVGSGGLLNYSGGTGGGASGSAHNGGGGGGGAGSALGNGGNGGSASTAQPSLGGGGGGGVSENNGGSVLSGAASGIGAGGGSAFASGVFISGAANIVGASGVPLNNTTNAVIRFPLDGYYGGGGNAGNLSTAAQAGGPGAGGGGGGNTGNNGGAGGSSAGGGGSFETTGNGGNGGPYGGGAGAAAPSAGNGGVGGAGSVTLEW